MLLLDPLSDAQAPRKMTANASTGNINLTTDRLIVVAPQRTPT
jgi:hypothetical protein